MLARHCSRLYSVSIQRSIVFVCVLGFLYQTTIVLCNCTICPSTMQSETAIDYFGEQLQRAGYNFFGHERFYSGVTGLEFEVHKTKHSTSHIECRLIHSSPRDVCLTPTDIQANIYMGTVYYQRLRHMVSDKYQVRTTGPINNVTHQPVKVRTHLDIQLSPAKPLVYPLCVRCDPLLAQVPIGVSCSYCLGPQARWWHPLW